ncbi:MAG: hypothetical protein JWL85_237 [Candidatus Saccharibacteria bacterium]|nr:hypothetical protein [Candidatus Saccharibacteria bacterium]
MKILITGAPGVGKTTIAHALEEHGYAVIDSDNDPGIAYWENKATGQEEASANLSEAWYQEHDWKWRINVLYRLVETATNDVFVCGDASNKSDAFFLFDLLIVLTSSDDTLQERLESRTTKDFGKKPVELTWAFDMNQELTKEILAAEGIAVDANRPVDQVVHEILSKVDERKKLA